MIDQRTAVWTAILDDFGELVAEMWDRSVNITGLSGARDARILSVQIFKRLRDSRNAFALLWGARLNTEAETLVRSAIEAAICLAALRENPAEFLQAVRSDAAFTLTKQAPIWFSHDAKKASEAARDTGEIFGHRRADGTKHAPLNWQALAESGRVDHLYKVHRYLSGTAAHITGVSLLNDIEFVDPAGNDLPNELRTLRRLDAVKHLCGAVHVGVASHATTAGFENIEEYAAALMERMADAG